MNNRKKIIIPLVLLLVIGGSILSNSQLENTRLVDIVQLVAFGMLLGVLIVNVVAKYRKK